MVALITAIVFGGLALLIAVFLAYPRDRRFLVKTIAIAGLGLFVMLIVVDSRLPFSGGGDDENYYELAALPVGSVTDLFNPARFIGYMEQPGYPLLLSFVNYFTGQNLLAYKVLNLALFLMVALVWYRIGALLDSPAFGRAVVVAVLLLTPMWFYVFMLRKDMAVVLCQSLFLLGLVGQMRRGGPKDWILIAGSTFAVILFRSPLVLMHLAVVIGMVMVTALQRSQSWWKKLLTAAAGVGVAGGVFLVASNPDYMYRLGIYTEHRLLLSREMVDIIETTGEKSEMRRDLFPILYLLSETSGLNPNTWVQWDAFWLRGVLGIPWLLGVVPFFLVGILVLAKRRGTNLYFTMRGRAPHFGVSPLFASPWTALVLFILVYMVVSWKVGDTTRWRISDMPAIATVALAGWRYSNRSTRQLVMLSWIGVGTIAFLAYYMLRDSWA